MAARTIQVRVTGQDKLKANITYLRANFPDWLAEANRETADEIRDEARNNVKSIDAFDTGELFNSIESAESPQGLRVSVYSTSKHAPFIEFGTSPHFPPIDKIRAWCVRKGIPVGAAFPIARAISERGTPERPWLYPAYRVGIRRHIDRVRRFVGTGLQKLA